MIVHLWQLCKKTLKHKSIKIQIPIRSREFAEWRNEGYQLLTVITTSIR